MAALKKALLYGFLVWLIPFVAGFFLFSLHESNRILFESIMPLIVTASASFFGYKYLKKFHKRGEGLKLGLIWILIAVCFDAILFLTPTPMQMAPLDYLQDIALIYLIIPMVTISLACIPQEKVKVEPETPNTPEP